MKPDEPAKPVRRVVALSDFTPGSQAAVARAMQLAKAHGARVDLLHAFDVSALAALRGVFDVDRLFSDGPAAGVVKQRLSEVAASLAAQHAVEVEACFGVGDPATVIAAHVKALHPAVVVIGLRAHPADPGVGSTLLRVLRRVECPVLVARAGQVQPYRTVLSAVDLRDASRRAALAAATLFPDAQHHLMSALDLVWEREVWSASGVQAGIGTGVEALRGALTDRLGEVARVMGTRTGSAVTTVLAEAPPSRAIVDSARALGADCVAVGRHGQGLLAERLIGSTALDVLHHTSRDVLVVS
jgi:universal stress protein E